jgi:hypothetical protein
MKTLLISAGLWLSLTAIAQAQDFNCTTGSVAGTWGYIETGTVVLPTGAIPYASVGKFTLDLEGNYSAVRTASAGGTTLPGTFKGTLVVNPDCTGTLTQRTYDAAGNVTSTAVKTFVFVDRATEAYAIITSNVQGATTVPVVLTTTAKKLFPAWM